jgi:hypothetical protein
VALRNNRAAFERIKLKTQVLIDVSKRNQEITLFGKQHGMPLGIAPTGPAGMLYYKGELELARAAKAANIPFTLATGSQTSMEEVAKVVGGTLWFQLYMWSDCAHVPHTRRTREERRVRGARGHAGRSGGHEPRVQRAQRLHRAVPLHEQEHGGSAGAGRVG